MKQDRTKGRDWVLLIGDVMERLQDVPKRVQCVVTSPPYWGLRDYGADGQLGLEKTPEEYVDNLVKVFRAVREVMRDDGVLWLNLGDTYFGGGNNRGSGPGNLSDKQRSNQGAVGQVSVNWSKIDAGLKPKDLCGIPWRVAFALQSDGWWLRSDVIWHKPNPMPESVTDRPTKSHEYVFLLTKSADYFYDARAVKENSKYAGVVIKQGAKSLSVRQAAGAAVNPSGNALKPTVEVTADRNKRSVWTIPTQGYAGAHFATFPETLASVCILSGTSEKGCCAVCGAPYTPIIHSTRAPTRPGRKNVRDSTGKANRDYERHVSSRRLVGWNCSCEHDAGVAPCLVLDPFAGSGTTLKVARELGRRSVGIEISEKYAEMARDRVLDAKNRYAAPGYRWMESLEGQMQLFEA